MNRAATRAGIVLAAAAGLALTSCRTPGQDAWLHQRDTKAKTTQPATAPTAEQAVAAATQPVEAGPPDVLARKAELYAQSLQQALEARQHATTQGVTAAANQQAVVDNNTPPATTAPTTAPAHAPPAPPAERAAPAPAPASPMVEVAPPLQVSISPASSVRARTEATAVAPNPVTTPIERAAIAGAAPPEREAVEHRLAERVKEAPRDPAAHLDQQLLSFVKGEQVPNLAGMSTLQSEDRELLSALLDGLSNYRAILRSDPNATTGRKNRPLLEMADRIREQSELTLPAVRLCTAVRGYGLYDVMDAERLPAGRDVKAIVYCEVANFASRPDAQQMWETRLTKQVTLLNESDGRRVWSKPSETIPDRCQNRRHDFYCISIIQLPKTLPAGRYVMKVTVTDQQANKVAESSLPVVLVGTPGL
jgi:hypothetical protein